MADAAVLAVAIGFAGMGAYAFATPSAIPAIFGGTAPTADARNEVRAVYGGFGLALAVLLAWAALADPAERDGVVLAAAIAVGGMGAGRLLSGLAERPSGAYPVWAFCALELAACALLIAAI